MGGPVGYPYTGTAPTPSGAWKESARMTIIRVRIENGKPTVRWGRKARGLNIETARLPKPEPRTNGGDRAPQSLSRRALTAEFTGAMA